MGSEDLTSIFLKGIFVQEGSSGTCFGPANLKLKPSLFTPCPSTHCSKVFVDITASLRSY